jgi:hypothetical protein
MPDYHIVISLFKADKTSDSSFIPASLFDTLPSHSHLTTANLVNPDPTPLEASLLPSSTPVAKDHRLGPVVVNWVDFVSETQEAQSEEIAMKRAGKMHHLNY